MAHHDRSETGSEWTRLCALLEPVHEEARLFARRVARSDAEGDDLFHEAILRAHAKLDGLRDPERFRPWLFQVIATLHRSRWRRRFWRRMVSLDSSDETPDLGAAAPEVEARAGAERARRALAQLPAVQREAIVLFELHGCSVDEIAGLTGASPSAVKSRLSRGRARLRAIYRPTAEEDEAHAYSEV